MVLAFIVGEWSLPSNPEEWLGFLFFPFGVCLGMILAWRKEGLGGSITVGSLLVFYVVHLTTARTFPQGWAWLAFAAPGFLFLLSAYLSLRSRTAAV
jgi:glucose-6-phosphate-specific signal transduction histidine kinase